MPETRLQSDMIQNMGRSARAAMLQRGRIAANQQEWLDYVYARDAGAFYGDPYGGDSSGEHLIGQTNPYAKYYAAQQAKQLAFQRQRFLNAQSFQNNYMLQQQKFMLGQAAEEQKVTRNKNEMERKLKFLNRELDNILNHPEVDLNDFETKNAIAKIKDDIYEVETGLERNTPQIHQVDSGYTKTVIDPKTGKPKEVPIMSEYWMGPDDQPVWTVEGSKVAADQLERDKIEQAKINAARTANLRSREIDVTEKNAENAAIDKRRETADKLEERKRDAAKKRRDKINSDYRSQQGKQDISSSDPEEKRKAIL